MIPLIGSLLGFLPTLFGVFGDVFKAFSGLSFLHQAIIDAESTTLSGADKLTKVLNDFEGFIGKVAPSWAQPFETIAGDVEKVVNAFVDFHNLFKKA